MRKFFLDKNYFDSFFYNCFRKHKIVFLFLLIAFIIGIIVGFVVKRTNNFYVFAIKFSENYYVIIFDMTKNPSSLLLKRIFNNLLCFILLFSCSLTVLCLPMYYVLSFYRGFVLGCMSVVLVSVYGVGAIICIIFLIVPQHFISLICFNMYATNAIQFSLIYKRQKRICEIKENLKVLCVCFVMSLLGGLVEFLLLIAVIRPLNFYF